MGSITNANDRTDDLFSRAQLHLDILADLAEDNSLSLTSGSHQLVLWDDQLREDVGISDPDTITSTFLTKGSGSSELIDLTVNPAIDIPNPSLAITDYYASVLPTIWTLDPIAEFTDDAPAVVAPIAPTPGTFTAPEAHVVSDVAIPDWESKALPTDVEIFEVPISAPDVLEISNLALAVPDMNLVLPTNSFSYEEQTYSSDLLTSIEALLSADVENGGYGINPNDEQALYDRADERESKLAAQAVNQARKGIAARGFPVPPGSLYATENVILAQNTVSLAQLNREIVLKRSDLYVAARQFAVQQGLNLEQALITYTGARQERALKAGQITAELAIQFHNAAAQLFDLRVTLKRLELDIHKDQLATAAAKLQEYGQKLAYADMNDKRNQVRLEQYNQRLEAVKVFYDAQAAEANLIKLTVDIERLKLQANQDEVTTYATKVKAKADEYELFRTAWGAEETKQKVFAQQLAAHDQQVETVVKRSQLKQDQFNSEINLIKIQREKHTMLLEQYGVILQSATLDADVGKQMNQEQLEMWRTKRSTEQFNVDSAFRKDSNYADRILAAQQLNIKQMDTTIQGILKLKELNGDSAQSALELFKEAIKGAESSRTVIETVVGT